MRKRRAKTRHMGSLSACQGRLHTQFGLRGLRPRSYLARSRVHSGVRRPPTIKRRMRKQYYFRPSPVGLLAWDVDRLVELSRKFSVRAVPLEEIQELDAALF